MQDTVNALQITADVYKILPVLSGEKIAPSEQLTKYGADSLDIVQLLTGLENKYNVKFDLSNVKISDITIANLSKMVSTAKASVDVKERLISIFKTEMGIVDVKPYAPLKAYNMDCSDALSLMNVLEKEFYLPLSAIADTINRRYRDSGARSGFVNVFDDAYNRVSFANLVSIVSGLVIQSAHKPSADLPMATGMLRTAQEGATVPER